MTEIKLDTSTLPENGQRVRYLGMTADDYVEGVYNAEDQVFWTSETEWEFADHVDSWEPID